MPRNPAPLTAQVYITKFAAAERQLNAAIRMLLANEDELAVHTVAAAAYRIFRDLKTKRGRNDEAEMLGQGLYAIATDVASGRLSAIPPDITGDLVGLIESIVTHIRSGKPFDIGDAVHMFHSAGGAGHWREFNATANFLKHADTDASASISANEIGANNIHLLLRACRTYMDLLGRSTPEIHAFVVYAIGDQEGFESLFWSFNLIPQFKDFSPTKRRRTCLALLRYLKKHWHLLYLAEPQPAS